MVKLQPMGLGQPNDYDVFDGERHAWGDSSDGWR
jgi:hypothetical protein